MLVTVTVPKNPREATVNLKAPLIINADTRKASQIIVESDYPVKYKIYEYLRGKKEKAGE